MKLALLTAVLPAAVALVACDSPGGHVFPDGATVILTPTDTSTGAQDTASTADDTAISEADTVDSGASEVCARWNADTVYDAEGTWTGSASACEAGEWLAPGPDNTLRQVNLYRWMAGLPAVELSAAKSASAQACALIMHANNDIAHEVPPAWDCQTSVGRQAAMLSNLATTAGVEAVALYMDDGGVANLGHRRWILANSLGPIGVGSTTSYSCLHVIGGSGDAGARWTAWPPPGDFPFEAVAPFWWTSLDDAGWSIQSDTLDLRGAQVTVTSGGQPRPVTVTALDAGYGSQYAIRLDPVGWASTEGETYHVAVRGLAEDIDYDVRMVDCAGR